jgi:outer membrane protein assembly factor BamB
MRPPPLAKNGGAIIMGVICKGAIFAAIFAVAGYPENWPQWRGPNLNGISGERGLPVKWSPTENIAWRLPMPSKTGATPIIWEDRIFLNVAEGESLNLWCVDKAKGTPLWKKLIATGNYQINKQNMSSPSPVTDGKAIYAMTGLGVFKAFDFAGNQLWVRDLQKEYGAFGVNWGYASSPLLFEDGLYVEVLHGMKTDEPSYVLRIDPKTGKTVWRVERPTEAIRESPDSYSTPTVLRNGRNAEIVISGGDCVTGHDPSNGKELWRGKGLNPENNPNYRTIASTVVFGDLFFVPSRVKPLTAFRSGGTGDITQTHKLWTFDNGPDVPTPVTDGKYLYIVNDRGIMWCLDALTGAQIWGGQRLKPAVYSSSAVLADGKLYIGNEDGLFTVVAAGATFQVLAENDMADYTLSSPAISDGHIFLRTAGVLYSIGK